MIFLRKLHKWLSFAIGLQVLVWVVTGSLMSILDASTASGSITRQAIPKGTLLASYGPLVDPAQLPLAQEQVRSIILGQLGSQPVYRVSLLDSKRLFDARTGLPFIIDESLVESIAQASYRGEGRLLGTQKLAQGSDELRGVRGAVWRSTFSDVLDTRVYVSAADGRVLAHRNNRWQLLDFLLMLHFMDYLRTDNFNNSQIIAVAFATLWLAFSGFILVFYSFSRRDFHWLLGRKS